MKIIKKILVAILNWESRRIIARHKPFIVAVTGSVGKTSAKDAIYCVFKETGKYVRKSAKSLNSEIGLPLTIIGVPNAWHSAKRWVGNILTGLKVILLPVEYPDCLILEIGADHPGDIRNVVKWLHPDIAVITKISQTPVHVEFFSSPEEVFEEKAALARSLTQQGTLVIFADDKKMSVLADEARSRGTRVVTYGTTEGSDVRGYECNTVYSEEDDLPSGISFTMNMENYASQITMKGVLGNSYAYPLLAAAGAGLVRQIPKQKIADALATYEAPKGRMNILQGLNGSIVIDDTYNSSPDAAVSALETLRNLECSGTKVAILGDMMELGRYSAEEHRRVVSLATTVAGRVILVGPRFREAAEKARQGGSSAGTLHVAENSQDAAEYVRPLVQPGDIILVKGSQSVRMERAAAILLRDPSRAEELLVRQEEEWMKKM